jgi:hypothetical protein
VNTFVLCSFPAGSVSAKALPPPTRSRHRDPAAELRYIERIRREPRGEGRIARPQVGTGCLPNPSHRRGKSAIRAPPRIDPFRRARLKVPVRNDRQGADPSA